MSDWSYFWSWTGPVWLVVTAYVGTFLAAGLVLFVVATVTGLVQWVGSLPARFRARNEQILAEREARQ